ncbi:hypothetical protein WAL18_08840 [Waltera acetigignens]
MRDDTTSKKLENIVISRVRRGILVSPPTIARFWGKEKSLYIGSNAIYFIQGKTPDGAAYYFAGDGMLPAD